MPGNGAGSVMTLLGALVVVIGVLVLAWWVTRLVASWGAGGFPGGARAGQGGLKLLGQLPLGRNERLVLVRCGEKCLLLGVTERSVTLLRELTAEEAAQWLAEEAGQPPPSFLEALKKNLTKNTKEK